MIGSINKQQMDFVDDLISIWFHFQMLAMFDFLIFTSNNYCEM